LASAAAAATAAATATAATATAAAATTATAISVVVADSWSLACCWAAVSFPQFTLAYLLNSFRSGVYLFWTFTFTLTPQRMPHKVMPQTHLHTHSKNQFEPPKSNCSLKNYN